MRPIQNAGGEETIRERSYPVAKATAITAGQVVQLSGGKVVPAAAAQTAAILGIAGEDHSGTVLTLETGGTPAAGDEYELYPALGSAVCALNAKATALVVSATGATAVRCIGHDYERHTIRCIAAAHMLAAKS